MLRFSGNASTHGHNDEQITVEVLRHMRQSGDWDVNWAKARLPPDMHYDQYSFSSHLYATFFFYRLVKVIPGTERWRGASDGFLVYRFLSALLATIAIGQTIRLGWIAGGWAVALGAGALVAVAVVLVQDAHYIRPEPFTVVLTLAAMALAWPSEALRPSRILGAAFVVGLLIACKVSMLLLAWVPLVPMVAAHRADIMRSRWLWVACPLALLAGFAAGAPTAVMHPRAFLHGVGHLMTQYAEVHPPFSHTDGRPVADLLARYWTSIFGWPAIACFGAGVTSLLWRRRWVDVLLLAGPVLVFGGYFATRAVFFERNMSHVVPLFAIIAGCGAMELSRFIAAQLRVPASVVVVGLSILVSVRSGTLGYRFVFLEYSGVALARKSAFEDTLRARYPTAEFRSALLLSEVPLNRLADRLRANAQPVLLRVADYGDDWTASLLPAFKERFFTEEIGVFPGTFPDLPLCTLLTYHSAVERYFLVRGLRSGNGRAQ